MNTDRASGLALIAGSAITLVVTASHPTGRDIVSAAAHGSSGSTTIVHAAAIAAEVLLAFGAAALTLRLSAVRDLSWGAMVAFVFGTMSLIVAAIASGWLAPAALQGGVSTDGAVNDVAAALFHYTGQINQSFAVVGFALTSVAILLWSLAMLKLRTSQVLAALGCIVSLVVLGGILTGRSLSLHGLGGIAMLGMSLWFAWAGATLLRAPSGDSQVAST